MNNSACANLQTLPLGGSAKAPATSLSTTGSFYLLASMTLSFLAGSSAPTPLYPLYQAQWGFAPLAVTVVFGIYALAVLASLLIGGRLSDHIGRRPVLLVAALVQVGVMLMFMAACNLEWLLAARIVQGLATGAALAAVGAGMLDLDKARGTTANAVAPMLGTASGALAAGLTVQFLPAPAQLIYGLLALVFLAQAVGVWLMREPGRVRAGAWASLVPRLSLPIAVRGPLLRAAPILVAVWALAGFYGSLGPALLRQLTGLHSPLLGGLGLAVLAASGAATVFAMRALSARSLAGWGAVALALGVALLLLAVSLHALPSFMLGTALAGMGFGAGFQGAVRSVVQSADATDRAEVIAVVFVISYVAMGVPAMVAGYLMASHGGILGIARDFGAVVIALALLALLGLRQDRAVIAASR